MTRDEVLKRIATAFGLVGGEETIAENVFREVDAQTVALALERATEFWEPQDDEDVSGADLDTLEVMLVRDLVPLPEEDLPRGMSAEAIAELREICLQVDRYITMERVDVPSADRLKGIVVTLRGELAAQGDN